MRKSFLAALAACLVAGCAGAPSRNIALYRAATHSSAADFNYTAQLVTDGIVEDKAPAYFVVSGNGVPLSKRDKEWLFDSRLEGNYDVDTSDYTVEVDFVGISEPVDSIEYNGRLRWGSRSKRNAPYVFDFFGTPDGENWELLKHYEGKGGPELFSGVGNFRLGFGLGGKKDYVGYKVRMSSEAVKRWTMREMELLRDGKRVPMMTSEHFRSFWISEGTQNEWVEVDLGAESRLDSIRFHWLNGPESAKILVSNDGKKWRRAATLKEDTGRLRGKARLVRVEMDRTADGSPFALSELEIFGSNDLQPRQSDWQVCRASETARPEAWIPATVPGTVLVSYIDDGAVPDPNWSENQEYISESYFLSDFVYRGKILAPASGYGERVFLCFDGINWKADVRLNGKDLGRIEGAFVRTRFDVTDIVRTGAENDVEVYIYRNANPGAAKQNSLERCASNGGVLGADNPTFHASAGWDWMPSIRGRNIGIWDDVRFETCGEVLVEDPFVRTSLNLPDTTRASVVVEAGLRNTTHREIAASFSARFGEKWDRREVRIPAGSTVKVSVPFEINDPALWWPNGYGRQNLYDVRLEARIGGAVSSVREFRTGIREITSSDEGGRLTLWVNGRRLMGKGGNWGFSESNLRYRAREYDIAVGYHQQQNFTMIRNWVGQVADEEFFEACDRHGIMVWQDFWLANPYDGPNPDDEGMFLKNADDFVRKIRNHPCIALYCGRNEGMPPATLDKALGETVARLHPGMVYIPHSAEGLVSGYGKYYRMKTSEYFGLWGNDRIHSERGMPNVMNYESLCLTMPEDRMWPQSLLWAKHDWTLESAQKCHFFNEAVENRFGKVSDAQQFCELAQWVNYDGYRAIFESRSAERRGVLLWMSHPAWPSLVWSTYDYFFDPTASFFGCKKACEPLHIQWNPVSGMVEAVNVSAGDRTGLIARATVYDVRGNILRSESAPVPSLPEDSTLDCFPLAVPEGQPLCYFLLELCGDEGGDSVRCPFGGDSVRCPSGGVLSENFYVEGAVEDDFSALRDLPKTRLRVSRTLERTLSSASSVFGPSSLGRVPSTSSSASSLDRTSSSASSLDRTDGGWRITLRLTNVGSVPALMTRLCVKGSRSGRRILPAAYSDNYFPVLPGRPVTVTVEVRDADCHGEKPTVEITGFNI